MPNTKFCQGISDISDSYTGFIIDTWGVLHDSEKVFDSAVECLKELKARKKFVLLMSNSELRSVEMAENLKKMGLPDGLYSQILTSGELLYNGITHQKDPVFEGLGQACYLIGGERARKFLSALDQIKIVEKLEDASFLLVSGWDNLDGNVAKYEEILRETIRRRMKILCINPDSRALLGTNYKTGTIQISRRVQELGGVVQMIGKPYKPIFHHAIHILHNNDIYPGQTVMIGDTMAHDITGATLVNMDTCLVRSGMHSPVFKNAATPADVNKILGMLVSQYNNIRPSYLVDRLKWGKALPDRKHRKRPN
ncbi:MAG: TIGR01459 family HAD-type hydrolase [Alphaproteobacteria bacterium]|jgi:HAD superfamily hydrolase (TIGR01459 family)|nr:TIGR01459 family HAD-type hydrolase [Alphaproteobacteria bacterium]MCB1551858.1 TIGR01459 family HAD-type hydrolase [Alphaproteobacteria bacterium]MCB9984637.1 TIGR01459 family HAD-type hydrolase [Micavibrio sp.]HRK97980.1 TIGR01459 family HAD-type hydrolase [Alphaproteobacteria bacterium]